MKNILFVILFIFSSCSKKMYEQMSKTNEKYVSFITVADVNQATKDGVYMNGYVVNLTYDKLKELNGKKIKISGRVTIIRSLENTQKEIDENGNEIFRQGRQDDAKHINNPKIQIVE